MRNFITFSTTFFGHAEMQSCWDISRNFWWKLGTDEGTTHGDCNMAPRWHKHWENWLISLQSALFISLSLRNGLSHFLVGKWEFILWYKPFVFLYFITNCSDWKTDKSIQTFHSEMEGGKQMTRIAKWTLNFLVKNVIIHFPFFFLFTLLLLPSLG